MFARRVFMGAGIYGLLALFPLYFLEERLGRDYPPAINHPEQYYGFIGVALAWQVLFILLARDPVRHRPLMIPAVLEKASYGIAVIALYLLGRAPGVVLAFAVVDLFLGALFLEAWRRTPEVESSPVQTT